MSGIFEIDKQFDFCYGHRVYNQELDPELSVDGLCKCRHLHGHNGRMHIGLKAENLERGMVTDFKNLECIKVLVDDVLDHKFIAGFEDPLFDELFNNSKENIQWDEYDLGHVHPAHIDVVCDTAYSNVFESTNSVLAAEAYERALRDKLEGLVVVKFVPTSENLCKMFADIAGKRLAKIFGDRVSVSFVDFWETPKSHCRYTLGAIKSAKLIG